MFYNLQSERDQQEYIDLLKAVGSLSHLFSESNEPYLYYRAAENIFCRAFNAENLSRCDVSADAGKDGIGIGLKTFKHGNGRTLQKIAEFNKDNSVYTDKDPRDIVELVSKMRNDRLSFTARVHDFNDMIYHIVTRKEGLFQIFEEPMHPVDLSSIRKIKEGRNGISFEDRYFEYNFYKPKSTLFKRFLTENVIKEISVSALHDPYSFLLDFNTRIKAEFMKVVDLDEEEKPQEEYIYLPLYSIREGEVQKRSALNQWNAGGRARHPDELYIPIPAWIHRKFTGFFPYNVNTDKESTPFMLQLPNHKQFPAKVCQAGGKALMSNPNRLLGNWLLRHVLQIPEGQLVTYEMLRNLGIDSVIVHKQSEDSFTINFATIGSYETFEEEYNIKRAD